MTDQFKTKAQLIAELSDLRARVAQLEARESSHDSGHLPQDPGQEFFRLLFEGAAEGIMVTDAYTRRIVHANEALCRMFGRSLEQMTAMLVEELHPPELAARIVTWFESHLHDFGTEDLESRCLVADGRTFSAEVRTSRVQMHGRPHILAFFKDISDRRRAEELARVQRDLAQKLNSTNDLMTALQVCLTTVIEASGMDSGGIYLVDGETGGLDLVCSQGLAPEFVSSQGHYDTASPNARLVAAGRPCYDTYVHLVQSIHSQPVSEKLIGMAVVPVMHDDQVIACLNVASHSHAEVPELARRMIEAIAASIGSAIVRLRAEQTVQESEVRFRELAQHINDIFLVVTPSWDKVLYVSPGYERVWGRSCESLYQSPLSWFRAVHDDDRIRMQAHIIETKHDCWSHADDVPYRIVRPDGSIRWIRGRSFPIKDETGRTVKILGIASDITRQRQAEEELRASEARYREMFDTMQEGIAIVDENEITVFANPAYAAILDEAGVESVVGRNLAEYLPDTQQAARIRQLIRSTADSDRSKHANRMELQIVTRKGNRKTILLLATPRYDEKRRFTGTIGLIVDITQIKQAEQALKDSEARFRELAELLPQIVFEIDAEGYITYSNRFGFESTGYSQEHIEAGFNMLTIIAPEDRPRVLEHLHSLLNGRTLDGQEYQMLRRDGTAFPVLIYGNAIVHDGLFVGARGIAVDITERKKVEIALRESEERWHFALEGSGDGVWDWNAQTNEVFFSRQWKAMLGYDDGDIGGSLDEWSSRVHPDDLDLVDKEIKKHFSGDAPVYISEHRMLCNDGSYKWILDRGKVISRTGDGKALRVIGTHADITERKRFENELASAKAFVATAIEQSPAGVLIAEAPDVRIRLANAAALSIRGVANEPLTEIPSELHPSRWQVFKPDGTQFRPGELPLSQAVLEGKTSRNVEAIIRRSDGTDRIVLANASPVRDADGRITAGILVFSDVTELKRAERDLREREERLSGIMLSAPIGIGIVSNRILSLANKMFCTMVGYSEEELIGQSVAKLYFTGEEFDRVGQAYGGMSTAQMNTTETRWCRKDGKAIDVILSLTPLDPGDWSRGITFTAMDITERKRAERDLQVAEEHYRALFEGAGEGVVVAKDGRIILANPAMSRIVGYSREETDNTSFIELIHPDDREMVVDRHLRRLKGEDVATNYDFRVVTKNGDVKWVRIHSSLISWQGDKVTLNFIEDITVRRQIDEEIRQFKTISDNAPYGTVIADLSGKLLYVNGAFARLHGYRHEELLGQNLAMLHSEQQMATLHIINDRLVQAGSFTSMEVWHMRRDRTEFPTLMNGVVIRDEAGQPQFLAATAADITELKRLQEFADRARRLEAAGRIAGQVAHDFNNLLGPLVAYPEFIKEEIGFDHPAKAYLDSMEAAAQQMADINQQLLSLGRRGHYNMEPLNLNEVIRQVLEQARPQTEHLAIVTDLAGDLMNVKGGAAQIVRVFANLVSNAVDAMKGTGTLTVATRNWYADNPIGAYGQIEKGEYVKVTVTDTGCGIPEKILGQVFEPFFTTKKTDKKRGSGLGLSVVHAIVEDHSGYVEIESREGEGTSVLLYFPITRDEQTAIGENQIVGGNETVLLVDDDRVQQEVTLRLLRRLGYRAVAVKSGEEALNRILTEPFDILLLDMIMPGGMDGVETYRSIKKFCPGQKAIIVSGFAEGEQVAEAQRLGAGDFIRKPLTLRSLAQALRRELDRVPSPQTVQ